MTSHTRGIPKEEQSVCCVALQWQVYDRKGVGGDYVTVDDDDDDDDDDDVRVSVTVGDGRGVLWLCGSMTHYVLRTPCAD